MSTPSPAWLARAAAAVVSVGVLAFGAKAISKTDSPASASAASVPSAPAMPTTGSGAQGPSPGRAGTPGMGAEVTGSITGARQGMPRGDDGRMRPEGDDMPPPSGSPHES
jgi:hypothetical protein